MTWIIVGSVLVVFVFLFVYGACRVAADFDRAQEEIYGRGGRGDPIDDHIWPRD
jgi:hypothetical protein